MRIEIAIVKCNMAVNSIISGHKPEIGGIVAHRFGWPEFALLLAGGLCLWLRLRLWGRGWGALASAFGGSI